MSFGAEPSVRPELRTAAEVRQLSVTAAREPQRVRLRGVITFFEETLFSRFLQDDTAGIYLFDSALPIHLVPGQLVEVEGSTNPGEYAPIVVPERITVLGTAVLPEARAVTFTDLERGKEDSQFVAISGIVRSVQFQETSQYHLLEIATGGGRLSVFARQLPVARAADMVDSLVHVRGVCSTQFNRQRQLFSIRLMVPRPEDLLIQQPAPAEPYALAARPLGSLLQFTPEVSPGHRVKVNGFVTLHQPGRTLYVQDGQQGLEVLTRDTTPLAIGDQVEVLGFPGRGEYTPVLQDATYRKINSAPPPAPDVITSDIALQGTHDCRLVQIEARLLDRAQSGEERYLVLEEGGTIFQAFLSEGLGGADGFAPLGNGSRLKVTGVCRIVPGEWQAGADWRAKAFRIQLRAPTDVVVVTQPPWWTLQRMLWIAAALAFVALAAFGWVVVLRRQVAERTRQLELQIQERQRAERHREIEQERARVAHDLHDDLGAGLTEVNMLSSLAKSPTTSPAEKNRYLEELTETARRMVTSLDEIVWAINPRNDTVASLASYFGAYAQRLLDLAGISCGLAVAEDLPNHPLDPKFRQELFYACKEALTNVVRHATATQVWLRLYIAGGALIVEVADNGHGFDPQAQPAGNDGLANMQDRLRALGGSCEITSAAARGTTVRFRAPLPEKLL